MRTEPYRRHGLLILLATAVSLACFEARERPTIPVFGDLVIISDPSGAEITIDGVDTGARTPVNLQGIEAGPHDTELVLFTSPRETFRWEGEFTVSENVLDTLNAALEGGCGLECDFLVDRGRVGCRATGYGDTCAGAFFSTPALIWPDAFGGSYAAGGRLLVAGILDSDAGDFVGDTISTLVYRDAWIGRQPVSLESDPRIERMDLSYWSTAEFHGESLLGLAVRETVVAADSGGAEDVLFLQFEITNVSDEERYRRNYPSVPPGGYTYRSLHLGFALDADIGGATDDLGSADPDLGLTFMYDADFSDSDLGIYASSPALVGLLTVEPPAGAAERNRTFWRAQDDWDDDLNRGFAWRLLAGRLGPGDPIADHPDADLGYFPTASGDYRFVETHGPLTLAPGDTARLVVALLLAEPSAGTYSPGVFVDPGDPASATRLILSIAAELRDLAARVPELWDRFRPTAVD
ncbi:MAG: PEGA domain-containing protein [Gemmatimonadetes bacterium]|uniref:PEGA domain-containing protein n=1 Tax=Candidatus Kutchimonas denitrificans TaxID=3056748 RepID=A0AAE4ZAT8_9BACT|nr:PEGA domain-containing protein [Gemmatimonadota bacterium]NIR75366.1 PEGA domain-containing protein [Candidatus Kutchimonas denitrificans]NIS01008.1 PEGA domain-containing protein [Gemmatimonadota bacterium]NIT66632.1 PEGA domain-containing protein [Gemmatimonadota bacterium]NIU53212.1 PEGA domain-containing protein [Gemmatimonadota bacterium]